MFVYVCVQYMYLSTFNINQFKTFFKYMDDLAISLVYLKYDFWVLQQQFCLNKCFSH